MSIPISSYSGALSFILSHSFLTKKGLKLCGDPRQPWVQSYIKNLDAKRKKSSKRARMKDLRVPGQTPAGGSPTI